MAKSKYSNDNFTRKIRELLDGELNKGLTYKMLENSTGVPQASLSEYYNGDRVASTENLIKLAQYFDCTIDSLLGIQKESTIDNVCDYLGINHKIAVGLKENMDILYGNVEEHKELNDYDESILITILEHLFTSDETFIDRLTRIVKDIVENKDANWLVDVLKNNGLSKNLYNHSLDNEYAQFLAYRMIYNEFHTIADMCGSTISDEEKEIIVNSKDVFSLIKRVSHQTLIDFDTIFERIFIKAIRDNENENIVTKLCEYFEIDGTQGVKRYQLQKLPPSVIQEALLSFDRGD